MRGSCGSVRRLVASRGWVLLFVGLGAASCGDSSLPFDPTRGPPDAANDTTTAPPSEGVGSFGKIVEIKPQEQGLVLFQTGADFDKGPGSRGFAGHHELAVGARHQNLQVHLGDSTLILLDGDTATVSDLEPGMPLLVVGRVTGAAVHAEMITNLGDAEAPEEGSGEMEEGVPPTTAPGPGDVPRCTGQELPYNRSDMLEFQGCWGGPSTVKRYDTGFVPHFVSAVGVAGFDRVTVTAALGGWSYAFPFQFDATTTENLVYHRPGPVDLEIIPWDTDPALSFTGGFGFEVRLRYKFCPWIGSCWRLGEYSLSFQSNIQHSTNPGPLGGETMDIATSSCPGVGLIGIKDVPLLNPLSLGFCSELRLLGASFESDVQAHGAADPGPWEQSFDAGGVTVVVEPEAMSVDIEYDQFQWEPELGFGFFLRFETFGLTIWDTPALRLGSGPFPAITTPFPDTDQRFSLALDPESELGGEMFNLYHPTSATVSLDVDPAPTLLSIVSESLLEEGMPVTVWLREEYLDRPIAGAPVTLEAVGFEGTPDTTVVATTDPAGIAQAILPAGEYRVTARYAGAETYLPSEDTMDPVYVYRPTDFVVWGANPGGIQPGDRLQFWGRRWADQVIAGPYTGDPSFQGFAEPISEVAWSSPPASAGAMPPSLPTLISVIVTTEVTGHGTGSTGNIAGHAILRVEAPEDYHPASGHDTWGWVRALLGGGEG